MDIYLSKKEIRGITEAGTRTRQKGVLAFLGIPFKERPDGSILVSRTAYEQAMGARETRASRDRDPDFGAIGRA